jgi:hypothetical protein
MKTGSLRSYSLRSSPQGTIRHLHGPILPNWLRRAANPVEISPHTTHQQHRLRFYTAWTQTGHWDALLPSVAHECITIERLSRRWWPPQL